MKSIITAKLTRIILTILCLTSMGAHAMNQKAMEKTVKKHAQESRGEKGVVEFRYNGVDMMLISDVTHNRMRIITPVIAYEDLNEAQIYQIMDSNFHRALDARYAVSDGVLYAAYIHPLSSLDKGSIKSAMLQVANLALSFDGEYTSGVLNFGDQEH
ncbi:MAG: hypothetical protein ACI93R_001068 [Flavobacteriales bacterium]|jgi:hypothetical protein